VLDQQFESTNPGDASTHTIHMTNLPYIYAEMNRETRRRRRFGCLITTVRPRNIKPAILRVVFLSPSGKILRVEV
jgi:hypothetical protein